MLIDSFSKRLSGLIKIVMIICNFIVLVIVTAETISREVFNINFTGYEEILVIFALWLYMMGAAYGTYENSQIKADILAVMLHDGKLKTTIAILASIFTLFFGFIFTIWAYEFAAWSFSVKMQTAVYRIPTLFGEASILVGLVIMTYYHIIDLLKVFKSARTGRVFSGRSEL